MSLRGKIIAWTCIIVVVFLIATQPQHMGGIVGSIFGFIYTLLQGVGKFIDNIR